MGFPHFLLCLPCGNSKKMWPQPQMPVSECVSESLRLQMDGSLLGT